jgi:hypothetical protein
MGEWSSYALSDFLLFSPQTYFRQFALINEAIFPVPVLLIALSLVIAAFADGSGWRGRAVVVGLAILCASSAWLFHNGSYADINWAADWFALGFAVQALALLLWSVMGKFPPRKVALLLRLLAAFVVLVYPLQAIVFGRPWQAAEIVGISPDATMVFTLLVLASAVGGWRYLLLTIPILWCVIGLLTLWTMGAAEFWSLAALVVAAAIALSFARAGRQSRNDPAPAS